MASEAYRGEGEGGTEAVIMENTNQSPTTRTGFDSGVQEAVVNIGFEDPGVEAEANLLFEEDFNSENEDDEELLHGRLELKKLVTKRKSVARGKEKVIQEGTYEDGDDNDTDYLTSSDEGSYKSGSDGEEEGSLRTKSRFPTFKPDDKVEFRLGMSFESKAEAKDAMDKYSITNRYLYYWAKNCADMLRATCSNLNKGYTWMVYIAIESRSNSKKWVVKTYHSRHTCNPDWQIPSATASWLVKNFFKSKVGVAEMKVGAMREMVKRELNCDVTLEQMKKAKTMIRKLEKGDIEEEYRNLEDYKEEILRSNQGNTCILNLRQPSPVFDRFYVCFDACKKGFLEGCRRLIGIDGAFLKTEVKGEILTAVGRDANNQMFPIAWVCSCTF
ncbi:unnamed protein product [Cuscuta epithymum]|uniref:Transposase MuDR plant domain-containing protein n=1 Tax=Cuscuta epithymum TaxID=186058 RepID=A0AAV0F8L3_9ASTE|nr:unnamed protein product [Cuscuta epithymum]